MDERLQELLMRVDVQGVISMADHLGISVEEVLHYYYGIEL